MAARWAGYKPEEFFRLGDYWQALVIAAYQVSNQIEAVLEYEATKKVTKK